MAFSDIISGSAAASATILPVQALGGIVIDEHGKFSNLPVKLSSDDSGVPTSAESAYILSSSFSGSGATGQMGGASIIGALNFLKASISSNLDAGGSTTEVQFNDSGALAGDSTFTFNKTSNVLTVSKLGAFTAAGAIDFDDQNMTNVDIDSGAIDGAIIGANAAVAGTFTTLIGTNVDGIVGANTPAAGTFTTLTANDLLDVNAGATITGDTTGEVTLTVTGVGSQTADLLQVLDSDGNEDLSVDKDGVTTLRSLIATTADINAGTVDAVIGGTTPAAGTFTTLGAATPAFTGDTTIFDDVNNADTKLSIGTSATEALEIQVLNGATNKTAEEIVFQSKTASGTAGHGKMTFKVDEAQILQIDDSGINGAIGQTTAAAGSFTTLSGVGLLLSSNATIDGEITGSANASVAQSAAMANGPIVDASDADMTTGSFGAALRVSGQLFGTKDDAASLLATGSAADTLGINQIPHMMFMGVDDEGKLQNYRLQVSGGMLQVNEVPSNVAI